MNTTVNEQVAALVAVAAARVALGTDLAAGALTRDPSRPQAAMYRNTKDKLNIDFSVERVQFPHIQTMDPRIVRIPPGRNNEYHRHAHESVFVVLAGEGDTLPDEVGRDERARAIMYGDDRGLFRCVEAGAH